MKFGHVSSLLSVFPTMWLRQREMVSVFSPLACVWLAEIESGNSICASLNKPSLCLMRSGSKSLFTSNSYTRILMTFFLF